MGNILKHPASRAAVALRVSPPSASVRLFEDDGHIRPMIAIEADLVILALRINGGSISKAARDLGVSRTTLYRKLLDDC